MSAIGIAIREERRRQRMTLRDLASKTGIDYSAISKYENGFVQPSEKKIQIIASALGVSVASMTIDNYSHNINISNEFSDTQLDTSADQLISVDSTIQKHVIQIAHGCCELCGTSFPNSDKFLETHFINWLNKGGTQTIDNIVALCPNCHKRIHLYHDPEDIFLLLEAAKKH